MFESSCYARAEMRLYRSVDRDFHAPVVFCDDPVTTLFVSTPSENDVLLQRTENSAFACGFSMCGILLQICANSSLLDIRIVMVSFFSAMGHI